MTEHDLRMVAEVIEMLNTTVGTGIVVTDAMLTTEAGDTLGIVRFAGGGEYVLDTRTN